MNKISYSGYRFPPEIIQLGVDAGRAVTAAPDAVAANLELIC